MSAQNMSVLAGTQTVDDGTTCTAGACPIYDANGALPQKAPSRPLSGLGGVSQQITLLHGRNSDGSVLAASAAAGKFGISITAGTSMALVGEAANNNTKTDVVAFEVVLPQFYKAGDNITLKANAQYTLNGGTIGTKTLAAAAYLTANDGTQAASIIATTAQTIGASAGDLTFTITGTTLTPGVRLLITLTMVIQETAAGGGIVGQVNSLRMS